MIRAEDIWNDPAELPDILLRIPSLGRLTGTSLWRNAALVQWLAEHCPPVRPATTGPLANDPTAGCYRLRAVAAALQKARAKNQLPTFMRPAFGGASP